MFLKMVYYLNDFIYVDSLLKGMAGKIPLTHRNFIKYRLKIMYSMCTFMYQHFLYMRTSFLAGILCDSGESLEFDQLST